MGTGAAQPGPLPLRAGTKTFLFTDIEGSTRLLQQLGDRYPGLLDEHLDILRDAVIGAGGDVFGTAGDAIFAVFDVAPGAVHAAAEAQSRLAAASWPEGVDVRVRMAIHTGEVAIAAGSYTGLTLHRVARICGAGWGGQVLVSGDTRVLAESALPEGCALMDLGEHRLKDLGAPEHLYELAMPGLQRDFPPLRSLDATPNNLPIQLTSFVGRDAEVEQVRALLARTRLVTVTGPGGTGKSRLAMQVGAEVVHEYPDGIWFVGLATVSDPALVASTIVAALGLHSGSEPDPVDRIAEYLHDKTVLLVLDNFEQVLDAAPIVTDILQAAPDVRALVTSRAPLHVYGEHEFPLAPLSLPRTLTNARAEDVAAAEAVSLFLERAEAVNPNFVLADDNAAEIAEIVERLDGLPLAIELAAARTKVLSPKLLAARLSDRLGLLTGGARDLPTRQQTLRDAIAWSYDLLDDAAKRLLARFSVFAGGASLEAAGAVCGPADELGADVLDGLGFLVDQSLVRQTTDRDGEPRFTLLETIREFAGQQAEAFGEAEEIRDRHRTYYLRLAEQAAPELTGANQVLWLNRLDAELLNYRAALDWSQETEVSSALRLVTALWRLWQIRGYLYEGRRWAETTVALAGVDEHPLELACALEAAGGLAYWQGDMAAAGRAYDASLEQFRVHGDRSCVANALYNLSFTRVMGEERAVDEARDGFQESLDIYRELGDEHGVAKSLWGLGDTTLWSGEIEASRDYNREALRLFRRLDDPFMLGWTLHMLGLAELILGDNDAETHFCEALKLFEGAADISGIVLVLDDFRRLASVRGDHERSQRLAGTVERLRRETGANLVDLLDDIYPRDLDLDSSLLDDAAAQRARREGAAMSVDEAVAYALEAARKPSKGVQS